ncbi:MAG TPA: DUF5753 domain-containing protein [Candidatus Saccharimonadales bacterium]|nr:DUF5753 domain-containing protein [Candidatus Saccharimonadales bacterium]
MDSRSQWWAPYNHALPPGYRQFLEAEAAATTIRIFNYTVMPGLLQTEAYATDVTRQFSPILSNEDIGKRIALRMERQWRLFERRPLPDVRVLIDESVLLRTIGSIQAHGEQLEHLLHLIQERRTTLQVLPFNAGRIWPLLNCLPFVLFETPQGSLLSMESATSNDQLNTDNTFETSHFRGAFDDLSAQALSTKASRDLIASLRSKLQSQNQQP